MVARQTVANLVIVPVGDSGAVDVYSSGGTHVLADVAGWFSDAGGAPSSTGLFVPVTPERLLDTRKAPLTKPGDGAQVPVSPRGQAGIPADGVSAVVLNVTATQPAALGFLTVFPSGNTLPLASDLNFEAGETRPNLVIVQVGTGGKVTLYTSSATHVIFDVEGYFN